MSLEAWSTFASVGTFVVITATAIAALWQLRHMRAANQLSWIQLFASEFEGPHLRHAFEFVRRDLAKALEDPAFRRQLQAGGTNREQHPEITVCNFFDQWGLYYRDGVIDRASFMRVNAGVVNGFWRLLEPVIALMADPEHGNLSFQQFEYLTVEARHWLAHNRAGDYPKGVERIALRRMTDEANPSRLANVTTSGRE